MELKISNFNKPSNPKFKLIADILLYTLPSYLTAIMLLPIDETVKVWINFGITMVIITVKAISKFTSNEEV